MHPMQNFLAGRRHGRSPLYTLYSIIGFLDDSRYALIVERAAASTMPAATASRAHYVMGVAQLCDHQDIFSEQAKCNHDTRLPQKKCSRFVLQKQTKCFTFCSSKHYSENTLVTISPAQPDERLHICSSNTDDMHVTCFKARRNVLHLHL